jgi:peptidoglycan/xylan/chitin deacetylase (PgdA/CDA1 family)
LVVGSAPQREARPAWFSREAFDTFEVILGRMDQVATSGGATSGATIALMYHALWSVPDDLAGADSHYAVAVPRFVEQLALCGRIGGAAVSARDWLSGRPGVIVTFDDGHLSNHRLGFPALRAAGASADFFVNPAQVGTRGFAGWPELREMADAGMSIQSHGLDHRSYLTTLSPSRLREELRRARLEIEEKVGQPVTLLAPPGGRAPQNLEQIAQEVGYTHVFGSNPATISRDGGGHTHGRFAVTAGLDQGAFESLLRGGRARLRAQLRYALLALAKRALGDGRYERARARVTGTSVEH